MFSQLVKAIVGVLVLVMTCVVFLPYLFPPVEEGKPRDIEEIHRESLKEQNTHNNQDETRVNTLDPNSNMGFIDDEFEQGYGDLLNEDGEQPPVSINNDSIRTGVVVGVENPTARGDSRAEAAKRQEEIRLAEEENKLRERQISEANARSEKERELARAKQEAELKAKKEAELRAKQEAELKAKKEAELKAKQEAELRAKKEAELRAKKEEESRITSLAPSVSTTSSRYLQVGVFSTKERAEQVKAELRKNRISLSKDMVQYIDKKTFGYKIIQKGNAYAVIIGPAKNDIPLQKLKKDVDRTLHVNSSIVSN